MKWIAPEHYLRFRCIAGNCRHSCCVGWEIDIDPESLERFRQVGGALGRRLQEHIHIENGCASFQLQGHEERCPFLNRDGLCDLILELGEDALCQICTDHPRYRSFFSDRTEIGLGLCCEAAGKLILGAPEPMRLIVLEDDGLAQEPDPEETALLERRDQLLCRMQDRSLPITQRLDMLLPADDICWPDWSAFLLSLERLDERWAELLRLLPSEPSAALSPALAIPMEQLVCSMLYRHLPGAMEDGDICSRIRFAGLMGQLIARLCRLNGCAALDELVELARLYSSEIEYSEENTCAVLEKIAQAYEGR